MASGDTKPTQAETNSSIIETDTKKVFDYNGTAWVERAASGASLGDIIALS